MFVFHSTKYAASVFKLMQLRIFAYENFSFDSIFKYKFLFNMKQLAGSLAILLELSFVLHIVSSSSRIVSNYDLNDPGFHLEFRELLSKYKPLDFGLGAPDFSPPAHVQRALAQAATSTDYKISQYAPTGGHPRLLKALSTFFSKLTNLMLNPNENVVATVGATEAIHASFQAHTEPGDEWIIFAPYFSPFDSLIKAAHGVPRYMPLISRKSTGNITSSDFKFDRTDLANLFNNRTKGILINTPHNPTGKLFDYEELAFIGELVKKWNAIVIFDEVYQFMNYDNKRHLRIATFPGMFERTITVGSASKMFSATGYRVGWAYGPKDLITNIKAVTEIIVMCAPTTIQEAIAVAIEEEIVNYGKYDSYLEKFRKESENKRNYMYKILSDVGMTPVLAESGYFITANWTTMVDGVEIDREFNEYADYSFIRWLVKDVNVYGYPLSTVYGSNDVYIEQDYIRITIIKKWETLRNLERTLKKWKLRRL